MVIAQPQWTCPKRRTFTSSSYTKLTHFYFYCYRRMLWEDDDPNDVSNAMQASVWSGESLV